MHTGNLQYHIVWCTKYRRKVLTEDVQLRLKYLIKQKCKEKLWELKEIETMTDHVHVFLKADSSTTLKYVANQIKGYTSSVLRKEFKHLKTQIPTLWTRSYYAGTIGHVSEETIQKYIQNQKRS